MRKFSSVLALTILLSFNLASGQTDSIKTYITDALNIMQAKSVNKAKVNWDMLRTTALNSGKDAKTIRDTYPVIRTAIESLNDAHSHFYPPEEIKAYTLGYRATGQTFPEIHSELKNGRYAYITLPDIGSFNNDDWNEYINTFYTQVAALQKQKPKGWIIDLRENFGGMLYPMYAAIAIFLDRQDIVATKDAGGRKLYFNYKNGVFYEGGKATQHFDIKVKEPQKIKTPVAVLVSKKTSSSGEFITAAFVGQRNATLIGANTQGQTSGNQEYILSDGAFLVLTIGNIVDRNDKEYAKIGEGIAPEITIQKSADKAETDQAYLKQAFDYIDKNY